MCTIDYVIDKKHRMPDSSSCIFFNTFAALFFNIINT